MISSSILKWRSLHLLGSLMLMVLFHPVVGQLPGAWGDRLMSGLITAVLLAAVWWTTGTRGHRVLAVVLVAPGLLGVWFRNDIGPYAILTWELFLFYVMAQLFSAVMLGRINYVDRIFTAISVYLLMAISFSYLHLMVFRLDHGAYKFPSDVMGNPETDMLYFSLVTILTLGYGDMVPISPFARMLSVTEAFIGSFFIAILISRLVSLGIKDEVANRPTGDEV